MTSSGTSQTLAGWFQLQMASSATEIDRAETTELQQIYNKVIDEEIEPKSLAPFQSLSSNKHKSVSINDESSQSSDSEPNQQRQPTVVSAVAISDDDDDDDIASNIGVASLPKLSSIKKDPSKAKNYIVNDKHCIIWRNINCWTGISVYLLSVFLTIISILYAFGQITSLEVADFFCPEYTEEEVRQHSIQNGLNKGDPGTCWSTKSFRVCQICILYNLY